MSKNLASVCAYLEQLGWPHHRDNREGLASVHFQGVNGRFTCVADASDDSTFRFLSMGPERVPPQHRGAMLEVIARANVDLPLGCFEFDVDQGSYVYRTSIDSQHTALTHENLASVILGNLQTMDAYLPALLAVGRGQRRPAHALSLINE